MENFEERPKEGFYELDFNDTSWSDIQVPGNWEVQGFRYPIYVNTTYEFTSQDSPFWDRPMPPLVPREFNPTGTYRKEFDLPSSWQGKDIIISFDGVKGASYFYLNGEFLGMSKDSKLPVRFNITSRAKPGKNVIAMQTHRWSEATYLECQDFWRISGIERDVYLYARPKVHIADFFALPSLDASYTHGEFSLSVDLKNAEGNSQDASVTYTILDRDNNTIATESKITRIGDTGSLNFSNRFLMY